MAKDEECSIVKGCNGVVYVRFITPDLDPVEYPSETPCRRHTAVLVHHLLSLTRNVEIEEV